MAPRIKQERPEHFSQVDRLLRAAFAGDAEARLVDELRREGHIACALVAKDNDGSVIGHIVFSRLGAEIAGAPVAAVALAPLAVAETNRRNGIGATLVTQGLRHCRDAGFALAVVLGDPGYYHRFGFSAEKARGLRCPYVGPHLQAAELAPGTLGRGEGRLSYAPPFHRLT